MRESNGDFIAIGLDCKGAKQNFLDTSTNVARLVHDPTNVFSSLVHDPTNVFSLLLHDPNTCLGPEKINFCQVEADYYVLSVVFICCTK